MIEFINLVKKYDHGVTAIDNVNLKIDKGEFAFLVGPSGSGKSTFLRLLIKEEEPTSGKIIVDGKDITRLKKKDIPFLKRKIGFVFQDFRLLYDRTVEENIVLALRVIEAPEKEIKAQLKSVLQMVGLVGKEKFFPNQLSGGEQQRVALARALNNPGSIDATMIVDLGEESTDIVIMYKDQPRLVRSIPGGVEVLIRAIANGLNVRPDQARQFLLKFGLDENQVEGQVFRILNTHLDAYAAELAKSVRFFQTKYINGKVGGIVLSSYGEVIPLFPEYIEAKTGVATMRGNPWQFVRASSSQQRALANVSNEFAVAIGLSERSND